MCLFASPSGKWSTHTNLLVGVTPRGKNTDKCLTFEPHEPPVILVKYEVYLHLFIFFIWIKIPDG